jgi:hypothetical protein
VDRAGAGVAAGTAAPRSGGARVVAPRRPARALPAAAWIGLGVVLALALRAPWLGAPLGNDEGGLAYLAVHWHGHGPFLYGNLFIDRPVLLLAVFKLAILAGPLGVRLLGAACAAGLVVVAALLARQLGGRRALPWAALIAGALASSAALSSVFTPAELPAALASTASVLALAGADARVRGRRSRLYAAGLLAAGALLFKQSFGDALVAGMGYLAAIAVLVRPGWRGWLRQAAAYGGGLATAYALVAGWALLAHVPDGAMSYALIRFRIEGLRTLSGASGGLTGRLGELLVPLLASGLPVALAWLVPGLRTLGGRPALRVAVVAWALAGLLGVLGGGSYWSHYLIELVPVAAVGAAIALSWARPWALRATAGALAVLVAGGAVLGAGALQPYAGAEVRSRTVGEAVHAAARTGDTVWVRWAQANVLYYAGLPSPYPYAWSLMLETVPSAQARVRAMLRSSRRPTWIVAWEQDTSYGLDRGGGIARLIAREYRPAGTLCGHTVLLERGKHRTLPAAGGPCA